jgi:cytochrome P450
LSFAFDPFSHSVHLDPYPLYRTLRDEHRVYHNPTRGFWALSRFEDVQAASRDWQRFSNADSVDLDAGGQQYGEGNFLDSDPPRHERLRDVLRQHFIPRAIAALEPAVRSETELLLGALEDESDFDAVERFAAPLPVAMIARLMGIPAADRAQFQSWTRDEIARDCEDASLPAVVTEAVAGMRAYFEDLIGERRLYRSTADDVMTTIVAALDDGRLETQTEAVDICLLIVTAGTETTTAMIANSLLALDRNPAERSAVAAGDVEPVTAVEELLRYDSPIQMLARTALEPVTIGGVEIPAGARVLLVHGAANRDERRYPEPDRLQLDREPRRHLAFGDGIHHCLGAPLARLEGRIAIPAFLARFSDYTVLGPPEYLHKHNARRPARLPLAASRAREAVDA